MLLLELIANVEVESTNTRIYFFLMYSHRAVFVIVDVVDRKRNK